MITIEADMAGFQADLAAFAAKAKRKTRATFMESTKEVERSVKFGSAITAAPGQPVDTGFLRKSWKGSFVGPWVFRFTTQVAYAPFIESRLRSDFDPSGELRPPTLKSKGRSTVGGSHSVKLTRGGWKYIVDDAAKKAGP